MVAHPVAQSASRRVWVRLGTPGFAGEVQATFRRACMVVDHDSRVTFLVLPEIGNGPLNIVVGARPGVFAGVERGSPAGLGRQCLRLGPLVIQLNSPAIWEPRPDWERFRAHASTVAAALPALSESAAAAAPGANLLRLMTFRGSDSPAAGALDPTLTSTVQEGIRELEAGWEGQAGHVRAGAARLAGLGSGLTPAGDDFLVGLMLWSWLAHPAPAAFCQQILEVAAPRTTRLSEALLSVAACGECSAPWHRLLEALANGSKPRRQGALRALLAFGATSGADALAGFLWMGLEPSRLAAWPSKQARPRLA